MVFAFLSVAVVLGYLVFSLATNAFGWHWSVGVLLALIPIATTYFFGIIGLLGSAIFVSALYKAAS